MQDLGKIHQLIVPVFGYKMSFNIETIIFTWIAMSLLVIFGLFTARRKSLRPGALQLVGELFVDYFYGLADEALGKELGKKYGPYICGLFMFLTLSNWLGILPHLEEPTKDLNTPLGMSLIGALFLTHFEGIRVRGLKNYLSGYVEPFAFMLPINIISELANVISVTFRLFGNIMGGAIIILVVSHLTYSFVIPPFLNAFFGLFVGTIQAYVFTMLTTVYISLKVK